MVYIIADISPACHILWSNRGRLASIAIPDSSVQLLYRKELIRHESSMSSLKSMPMSSLTSMPMLSLTCIYIYIYIII